MDEQGFCEAWDTDKKGVPAGQYGYERLVHDGFLPIDDLANGGFGPGDLLTGGFNFFDDVAAFFTECLHCPTYMVA